MKIATLSLGATTAVFAATSIYLAMDLGAARDQLAVEQQARTAQEARIAQLESERRELDDDFAQSAPPTVLARDQAPLPSDAPRPLPPAAEGRMEPPGTPRMPGERWANIYDTPAGQRTLRVQQETRLRRMYADMPAELGLDAAQADQLFDLLADNQAAMASNARTYAGDRTATESLAAAAREERNAAITALLGPEKAAEFQTFEQTIGARMQVGRIGENMAAANVPLSDTQKKALIAVVAKEQAAKPQPSRLGEGEGSADQSRYLAWQADYSKRVQQQVEPLLSSDQRARYREAVEVQNAQRDAARARAEARRNAVAR